MKTDLNVSMEFKINADIVLKSDGKESNISISIADIYTGQIPNCESHLFDMDYNTHKLIKMFEGRVQGYEKCNVVKITGELTYIRNVIETKKEVLKSF